MLPQDGLESPRGRLRLPEETRKAIQCTMRILLQEVYDRLFDAFGPQKWWPGDAPFEMMVGAILVQNTSWKNVKRPSTTSARPALLEPHALYAMPEDELEELLRPAGYYRIKTKRLRSFLKFLVEHYDGSIEAMFQTPLAELRQQLLGVHGVGPETADSILLYAGGLPVFVVDAYTYRVFSRHGWIDQESDYDQVQEYFHDRLPGRGPAVQRVSRLAGPPGKRLL